MYRETKLLQISTPKLKQVFLFFSTTQTSFSSRHDLIFSKAQHQKVKQTAPKLDPLPALLLLNAYKYMHPATVLPPPSLP
jgi:hypothetical protein